MPSTPTPQAQVTTGVSLLDAMLDGGYPAERTTLLVGGPGTGKSTLGMQFLQAGLDDDGSCLFVSTEQTIEELRSTFAPYSFSLDDPNLAFTTVHATEGRTIEDDEAITLRTLDGADSLGDGFSAPFEPEYIRKHLDSFAPCDRIVFDSISGLSAISENRHLFRRVVLDLIRLFTDEFGATTVLTAEELPGDEEVTPGDEHQFATHGVVRLRREPVREDTHRYLEVTKMRGVDHDRRAVEMQFEADGITLGPARRSQPPQLKQHGHVSVGIDGLDQLTGGGLIRGSGVLLQHDGRANVTPLLGTVVATAVENDEAVVLAPDMGFRPDRLDRILQGYGHDLDALLAEDRLFVVDLLDAWDDSDNVFGSLDGYDAVEDAFTTANERAGDARTVSVLNADSMVHALGPEAARDLRYVQEADLLGPDDALVHVANPDVLPDRVGAFYVDVAGQVLETWLTDAGLQYVTLRKSPCGFVGSTSLVEYLTEPPFVSVQRPPRDRENPMAVDDPGHPSGHAHPDGDGGGPDDHPGA